MGNYPVALSKEVAGCVDKGRAVNVHLDFSKAFDMVFCSLFIAELKTWGLEKRIIGCVKIGWATIFSVVSSTMSN